MIEKRLFTVLAFCTDHGIISVTGLVERYNSQLQWEAVFYPGEADWLVELPRQAASQIDIQDAYALVVEGYTDFAQELKRLLCAISWDSSPIVPFEMNRGVKYANE